MKLKIQTRFQMRHYLY